MRTTSEIDLLLLVLDQAYDHRSWHGTNLRGALRRVSLAQAGWRPGRGRHNISELVVHCAYWKYAVWRQVTGERKGSFAEQGSNWFPRPVRTTEDAWRSDVRLLDQVHRSLRRVIGDLDPRDLDRPPTGGRTSHLALITGVAAHDLYHAGQIQLLKRLFKSTG